QKMLEYHISSHLSENLCNFILQGNVRNVKGYSAEEVGGSGTIFISIPYKASTIEFECSELLRIIKNFCWADPLNLRNISLKI
ncbi:MAG: hypothetical protein IKY08_05675, partial [Firmicutes bacterium]|nr:hypothetical protein [Bacillota bacterium]